MKKIILLLSLLVPIFLSGCENKVSENTLSEKDFQEPPSWAKPRTWMHAMSGNMSKEGMTKDLEAISKVGIGGILLFNIANMLIKIVLLCILF